MYNFLISVVYRVLRRTPKALVFVERRLVCWVLMVALWSLKSLFRVLPRVRPGFVVGQRAEELMRSSGPSASAFAPAQLTDSGVGSVSPADALAIATVRRQQRIMEAFRSRGVNLLFCTSVLEEGIDVPSCALVVNFDPPRTFTAFIQCKVRAIQCKILYTKCSITF